MYNNHFEIFELPVSFDLNKDTLAQRYRDLQRAVHPDKYANAPDRERRLAMQKTVQINEAFQTLKNPLTRAAYLLQLQGIDENDGIMDGEFLMTQMDLREELAEIKQNRQAIDAFLNRIEKQMQSLTDTLSQQFAQENWQAALNSVRQFQFFTRLHEEALRLEEELI